MTLRITASVVDVEHRDLLPNTHRYDIEAPSGTPWAKLKQHMPAAIQSGMADGDPLTDTDRLGTWPLVDGVCLEPARRQRNAHLPLRISALAGFSQAHSSPLGPDGLRIGRGHPLVGLDEAVSREHLDIRVRHGRAFIVDLGSSNGTRLEGSALEPHTEAPWQPGQHLSVGTATLRLDVVSHQTPPREHRADGHLTPMTLGPTPPLNPLTLVEPTPPTSPPRSGIQWVAALAPIPVALVVALVLHSPMMLLFMALGPVTLIATSLDSRRGGKRATRKAWVHYRLARTDFDHAQHVALASERDYRRAHFSSPVDILQQARGRAPGVRRCEANLEFALRLGDGDSWSLHSVRSCAPAHSDDSASSEPERVLFQ